MNVIEKLTQKDNTAAYHSLLELEAVSAESDELYGYFEDFLQLLSHRNSYVRIRGFRMCCAQARWDTENKLKYSLPELLKMLEDEKPAAVRQCLAALPVVSLYKPELCGEIAGKLEKLDLTKYNDSMRPLIEKDIARLQKSLD